MIQWFERQHGVLECMRHPADGRMTFVTLFSRNEVPRVLASRNRAVMTRRARTNYLRVVDGCHRNPAAGGVTALARVCRLCVCRVFASGVSAVVTADAVAGNVDVIKRCRNPARGRMAVVTIIATADVSLVLAFCDSPVMA